jgi:hypothetical protein
VLSWHSHAAPSVNQRRLALPQAAAEKLMTALEGEFDEARQLDLTHSIVWTARRPR